MTEEADFLREIALLPKNLQLTPTRFKQPILKNWHSPDKTFSPKELIEAIESSNWFNFRATGYGVICGNYPQGYLIAIDCDRQEACQEFKRRKFPISVAFSSGKAHRIQILYYADRPVQSTKIREIGLEIRGSGHQSLLPPSLHPETEGYRWLISPRQTPIAHIKSGAVQTWVMEIRSRIDSQRLTKNKTNYSRKITSLSEIEQAKTLIEQIDTQFADDYWHWFGIGNALWGISPHLLPEWIAFSSRSSKFKPEECEYKWRSFTRIGYTIATLYYFARLSNPN